MFDTLPPLTAYRAQRDIPIILNDCERINFEWVTRWFDKIDREINGMLYGVRFRVRKTDENPSGYEWFTPHFSHLSTRMLLWMFEDLCMLLPRIYLVQAPLREMLLVGLIERLEQNINLRGATGLAEATRYEAMCIAEMLPKPY